MDGPIRWPEIGRKIGLKAAPSLTPDEPILWIKYLGVTTSETACRT